MICERDLTSLIGVDVIDTLLGSVGAIMQKCRCASLLKEQPINGKTPHSRQYKALRTQFLESIGFIQFIKG